MVTSFDRVRVEGPFAVEIRHGTAPGAVSRGSPRALDGIDVRVEDRTLVVRSSPNAWGGWPDSRQEAPSVLVALPRLVDLRVTGAGSVRAERLEGLETNVALTGAGRIEVARVETDRLNATLIGSGSLTLTGNARTARLVNNGVGSIDAGGLAIRDLALQSESAGESRATASQTATVVGTGTGSVIVAGTAACTVSGPAPIRCGRD